ncbi:MAG: cytochrome c oxidase subunit II [Xenococcaceae cyanobacterium MO_207.B15]|nr:cytochrome c oxidase subunit II [Xenococcaceae cyanobacterium MO_207.B15]MDJ0742743.1 cytochrome c oxidase subunit II [Xenococcaceae cyanobacterium MO_167.B27]
MNIPSNIITLIAGIALTLISLWYGQNHGLLPMAASEEAHEIDGLFNFMMTIATGLFLLVEGVLVYCVIKFRRRKGDTTDGPPIEGNVPLEIVWTAIPTVIVFILAIYSFEVYNSLGGLDPMSSHDHLAMQEQHQTMGMEEENSHLVAMGEKQIALGLGQSPNSEAGNPLVVKVNGIQYAWIFTYPETGTISGELHVPVNRPVKLEMGAGDVLHAFWLPEFRIKQDVIPGRESLLNFTPTKVGQYPVICAELCGAYHGGMKTTLTVHTEEDYQQWLQDNTFAQTEVDGNVALNQ